MIGSVGRCLGVVLVLATFAGAGRAADEPAVDVGVDVDRDAAVAQALRMAELIDDMGQRAETFARVAMAQAALGRGEAARATARRARDMADGAAGSRALIYLRVAQALEAAGLADEARAAREPAAREIDSRRDLVRQFLFPGVAQALMTGDLVGATLFADAIAEEPADARIRAHLAIAAELADLGRVAEARAALKAADLAAERSPGIAELAPTVGMSYGRALGRLATAEARAGGRDEARVPADRLDTFVDGLTNDSVAIVVLPYAATARHARGDDAASREAIDRCRRIAAGLPGDTRGYYLANLAKTLADDGMRDEAREALAEARRQEITATVARSIAAACLALGEWGPALASYRESQHGGSFLANALLTVARSQARAGAREARAALNWAEGEADPMTRAYALIGLLEGIAERDAKRRP